LVGLFFTGARALLLTDLPRQMLSPSVTVAHLEFLLGSAWLQDVSRGA
jgi:hypothetical protein